MDSDLFLDMARVIVWRYTKNSNKSEIDIDDIRETTFVVWSSKTLQNNKALIGTKLEVGDYFEVTYNGDKEELYLDVYKKKENIVYDVEKNNIIRRD